MRRINRWMWYLISGIFVVMSLIIFKDAWLLPGTALSYREMAYRKEFFNFFDPFTNLFLSVTLAISLVVLLTFVKKIKRKNLLVGIIVAISLLIQLYLIFNFKGSQGIDDFDVRQQAAFLAAGHHQWSSYFYFGPNSGAAIFFALVYQFSLAVGWGYSTILTNLAVMVLMDLAVWSGWLILRRHEKQNAEFIYLILCVIFVPLYLTNLFTYTDPLSLAFVMFGFSCLDAVFDKNNKALAIWKKYLQLLGAGVFLALAVYLKTNTAIAVIAVLIFILFSHHSLKKTVLFVVALLIIFVGTTQITSAFQKNVYNFKVVKNESFPYTYWIAMGLNPKSEGSSVNAWQDIAKYKTYQGKVKHTQFLIKKRLKKMGIGGLVKLYQKKIDSQWSLGTVGTEMRNYGLTANVPKTYSYFFGNKRAAIQEFQQVVYLTVWLLALIEGLFCFRRVRNQQYHIEYLLMLYVIGVFLFHTLIWEIMPRYAFITSIPLILLAAQGTADVGEWLGKRKLTKRHFQSLSLVNLILLVGIIGGSFNNLHYTKTIIQTNEPVISQQFLRQKSFQILPKKQVDERLLLPKKASIIQTSVLAYPQSGLTLKLTNGKKQVKIRNYQDGIHLIKPLSAGKYRLVLKNDSKVPLRINYFKVEPLDSMQHPITGTAKRYLSFSLLTPVKNSIYPLKCYLLIFLVAVLLSGVNLFYSWKKSYQVEKTTK
ncbi:MAG: hypothetical protein ABF741_02350 [Liquorilactobacillus ghanensis]|uniref:hypothetical protein n=1 Tax=Liquorilactobacillus ghanensis TaxID=399370 RepID=UPI0039E7C1BC